MASEVGTICWHMPKSRKESQSLYQQPLKLEWGTPPWATDYEVVDRAILSQLAEERFVRQVQEEVLVRSPADAANYLLRHVFHPFDRFEQEELWTLLLNTRSRITHEVMVYRGTVNAVHLRPAEVFREAVRKNAVMVVIGHCHPSGDPTPSPEDVQATRQLVLAGISLGIEVLDHVVVGKQKWVSLNERGLGFG